MITQLRRDVCYEEDIGWGRSVGEPQRLLETCPRGGHSGCRCSEVGSVTGVLWNQRGQSDCREQERRRR